MRWRAIIFSRICSLGVSYDVFPISEPPISPDAYYDKRDPMSHSIFLLPSLSADAAVLSFEHDTPSPSMALAGAVFLAFVRGLPLASMEIESRGKIYKISCDTKTKNIRVFLPKCKLICSNKEIFVDKTKISISETELDGARLPIVKCTDATAFSEEMLARLSLDTASATPVGAVAYSLAETHAVARARLTHECLDAPAAVATAVARCEGVGTILPCFNVEYCGSLITVESVGSLFALSTPSVRHFTFSAPDIF